MNNTPSPTKYFLGLIIAVLLFYYFYWSITAINFLKQQANMASSSFAALYPAYALSAQQINLLQNGPVASSTDFIGAVYSAEQVIKRLQK